MKKLFILILFVLCFSLSFNLFSLSFGEEAKKQKDSKVLDIKPLEKLKIEMTEEEELKQDKANKYANSIGKIELFRENSLIASDSEYFITKDTKYQAKDKSPLTKADFVKGDEVKVKFKIQNKEVVVIRKLK